MGLFEHWPYANFHDLNLDWIIKKIKNVETAEANTAEYAEAAAESAAASQLSADAALASENNAKLSEDNAKISEDNAKLSEDNAALAVQNTLDQITLLQSRVDNIIPQGTQTEGNTELLDIRVAYNGVTWSSAGNAVRGQVNGIYDHVKALENTAYMLSGDLLPFTFILGSLNTNNGKEQASSDGTRLRTAEPVNIEAGKQYIIEAFDPDNVSTAVQLLAYRSDNSYIGYMGALNMSGKTYLSNIINMHSDAAYIKVRVNGTGMTPTSITVKLTASGSELESLTESAPVHDTGNAFKCLYTSLDPFMNDYDINRFGNSVENRVAKLIQLYDGVTEPGVSIDKSSLGMDASNTFDVWLYKVSANTGKKPIVLVICGEHGDELTSTYIGYYAFKECVQGVLKKYLTYVDFWFVPIMNPYGYENRTRNNANDVNLNRDFPAEWVYSTSKHNKTGVGSLSQPETNYIYNLLVNNKDDILFMINKHDTGSIAGKITSEAEDIVCYVSTIYKTDTIINNGITEYTNKQLRESDPWIIEDCTEDISNMRLSASENLVTPGTLDLFANSIGIHGSLLEVAGSAYYTGEQQLYPVGDFHYKDLARLGLDFFVNYMAASIDKNDFMKSNEVKTADIRYYTRRLMSGNYVVREMMWTGSDFIEVPIWQ